MSQVRQSAMSVVTIVIFLVLMAVAFILYGGNAEQKAKLEGNIFWQKTKLVVDYGLSFGSKLIGFSPQFSDKEVSVSEIDSQMADIKRAKESGETDGAGAWAELGDKIKTEWAKDTPSADLALGEAEQNVKSFINIDWQKTDKGAEIIFSTKNGPEHKLPLPFKFLSR